MHMPISNRNEIDKANPSIRAVMNLYSFVGKHYQCLAPDSMRIGEIVEVHAMGLGPDDSMVCRVVGGGVIGELVIIMHPYFDKNYLDVSDGIRAK